MPPLSSLVASSVPRPGPVIVWPVIETSEFVGRIQAVNRVDLVARVTAFMEERHFTEGADFKSGGVDE